jgi:hypothetical protein
MLPPHVENELFDIRIPTPDIVLEHISDELERHSLRVDFVENMDSSIHFQFSYPMQGTIWEDVACRFSGSMRVDRMKRTYEVTAKLALPEEDLNYSGIESKKFDEITRYIALINEDADRFIGDKVVESSTFKGKTLMEENPSISPREKYHGLDASSKRLLDFMFDSYDNGGGTHIFNAEELEFGIDPDARDHAMDVLLRNGYIKVRGNKIVLDRTRADSLRAVRFG